MLLVGALSRFLPVIVARVATSLGIAVVSYAALSGAFTAARSVADGYIGGMATDIYAILDIWGLIWVMQYLLACVGARVAWQASKLFVKKV